MKKKHKHSEIVSQISKETGFHPKMINLVVRKFYYGMRSLMFRNEEINIKGFFTLKLSSYYRKKVEKEGKGIKIRKRKDRYHEYKDKHK